MQLETEQPMRPREHRIVFEVRAAQASPDAADALIGRYMPFIRSETYKFTHAPIEAGHEDELSIATLAFYEAALSYRQGRGGLLPHAAAALPHPPDRPHRGPPRPRGAGPPPPPFQGFFPPPLFPPPL